MFMRPEPAVAITIAYGDGIGPEIMEATLAILREAEAQLSIETIEVGERIYNMEASAGILPSAWDTLTRNKILLQAPVVEPENKQTLHAELCHRLGLSNTRSDSIGDVSAHIFWSDEFALFMPAHDTQSEQRDTNTANPSAMLLAAAMMLKHIGQHEPAARIRNALASLSNEAEPLTTRAFIEAMEARLWLPLPAASQ